MENRAGAGGTVGSALVAKAAPDGYTLLVADNGTHAIAPTLYGAKLPYDVFKDFTPITLAATFPTVIMIHPSVPAQNAQEFVALAKSQPGKLTYSSAGTGNGSHLTVELFRAAAGGLDMVHVPYKGGAPAIQALLAGEVQLTAVSANTALRRNAWPRSAWSWWPRRRADSRSGCNATSPSGARRSRIQAP